MPNPNDPWFGGDKRDGGRPIASMKDVDPLTRIFVWALRRWLDGVCGQQEVWGHLSGRMGGKEGARALSAFEAHLSSVTAGLERVVQRHHSQCACVCADEALMAATVVAASEGDLSGARFFAAHYIEPDSVAAVVETAYCLGAEIKKLADTPCAPPPGAAVSMAGRTLH
ncbi:MAG: hypothetical protein AAGM38_13525 [Pseudomonadota bacterium]